jgi:hypothetical protein
LRDIPGPIRDDDRPAPSDDSNINEGALDQATIDQVESEFTDTPTDGAGAAAESDSE